MKLSDVVWARSAMQKLILQDLPLKCAWSLMKMTDTCNTHLQFYGGEMAKLGPNPDPERLKELDNLEVEDLSPEKIRIPMLDNLRLSAADVKALEPFVEFYDLQE